MNKQKLIELSKALPQLADLYAKCSRCGKDLEVKIILICPDDNCRKHKKDIRDDNRLENLALLSGSGKHNTLLNREIKFLRKENLELKARLAKYE